MPLTKQDVRAVAPVGEKDANIQVPQVVCYQVSKKFVDCEESINEEAKEVMYFTLSVGHHTGVIDCLEEKLRCDLSAYEQVTDALARNKEAQYKLQGVMRHSEIHIECSSAAMLIKALKEEQVLEAPTLSNTSKDFLKQFMEMLIIAAREPAAYITLRVRMPL